MSSTLLAPPSRLRLQHPLADEYTSASPAELAARIATAKATLGSELFILGHHYQRDDVMVWADARGDSFGLSRIAAAQSASLIVFCGVHFMAESADILTSPAQAVFLPDLNAGCSMADMADLDAVEEAFAQLADITPIERVLPITYMNSAAAIKAFVGTAGGAVCTSSNASAVLRWALDPPIRRADKVFFIPDQHLGRNTGYQLGYTAADMALWNPRLPLGGNTPDQLRTASLILWQGHCSIHQRFRPSHLADFYAAYPDGITVVHPECSHEVVEVADQVGSTDFIIRAVAAAAPGTAIGIATEIHLVNRLATQYPDKHVVSLDPVVCPCSTMSRIDPPHLAWILESLLAGHSPNQISVDPATAAAARLALERMLAIN
jgi:quinolinate synthase